MPNLFELSDACISPCGLYRYSLSRAWDFDLTKPRVGWIMLNPSTADAEVNDPTIRRCMEFSRTWGFHGIAVRNLFAVRTYSPIEMKNHADPIGNENDKAILDLIGACPLIVAAWGTHGGYKQRDNHVVRIVRETGAKLHCLGTTKEGFPKHPLYVKGDVKPVPFEPPG